MPTYLSFDPAIRTLGVCRLKIAPDTNAPVLLDHSLIDLTDGKKVKTCSFDDNITSLITHLDNVKHDISDVVLIENIPSRMNMLIKSISVAIYTYYKIKNMTVKFVSPSKKLKNNKVSYKDRKRQSVQDVLVYLSQDDAKQLTKYKKVDDVADTILQVKAHHERAPHKNK